MVIGKNLRIANFIDLIPVGRSSKEIELNDELEIILR